MPIGGIVGGIAGAGAQSKAAGQAADFLSGAAGNISNIKSPTVEELKIKLNFLKEAGILTPEQEQTILAEPSQFLEVGEDQERKSELLQAADKLRSMESGLSGEDRAVLNQIRSESAQQDKAAQDSILQNMAARGVAGSGSELAARLSAQQTGAQKASQQGDRVAAMAQERAAGALRDRIGLTQGLKSGAENMAMGRAQALDTANRFKTDLQANTQMRNVGSRNTAQQLNLSNKQRVMDENVGLQNKEEIYNKERQQQVFENEMAKAQALNSVMAQQASLAMNTGAAKAAGYAAIGSGVDKAATSIIGMSDEKNKKNITSGRQSLEEFLDQITKSTKKYNMGGMVSSSGLAMSPDQLGLSEALEGGQFLQQQASNNDSPISSDESVAAGKNPSDVSSFLKKLLGPSKDSEKNEAKKAAQPDYRYDIAPSPRLKTIAPSQLNFNTAPVRMSQGGIVPGNVEGSSSVGDLFKALYRQDTPEQPAAPSTGVNKEEVSFLKRLYSPSKGKEIPEEQSKLPQYKYDLAPSRNANSIGQTQLDFSIGSPIRMSDGGVVPGEEMIPGDHEKNDIVPMVASAGEIVLPKSAIAGGREGIDKFLDKILPKKYEYKDSSDGEGEYVSPMAQDLEKTTLGKDMVIDTPKGKVVDYGKGFGTLLASQALLKEKIDAIEKKLGRE